MTLNVYTAFDRALHTMRNNGCFSQPIHRVHVMLIDTTEIPHGNRMPSRL